MNKLNSTRLFFIQCFVIAWTLSSFAQDAIITGIIDGPLTGGVPKAIEIFVINDIPDLSIYGIGVANNGGGTDGEEFTFTAVSASAGDFIYIASNTTSFNAFFGFNPNFTTGNVNVNGDDAVELFESSTVIDVFGDINTDGSGEPWDYEDGWAYRNNDEDPSSTFNSAEWAFSGINALDGETTNATATSPLPIGTYSRTAPTPIAQANPVPTMSQWGLLIFGLLIMNLGVFYVKKLQLT